MKYAFMIVFILHLNLLVQGADASTRPVRVVDFSQLSPLLEKQSDTVYVINFWATWCIPCVKELPDFEKINEEYVDQRVRVLLVSLDFPDQLESRVIPFMEKRNMKAEVLLLDDPDANQWINRVDGSWSGAIPATLIYSDKKRIFHEGMTTYEYLKSSIDKLLK